MQSSRPHFPLPVAALGGAVPARLLAATSGTGVPVGSAERVLRNMVPSAFAGFELLATAVMVLDHEIVVQYANPAAENLFEFSNRNIVGQNVSRVFENASVFLAAVECAISNDCTYIEHDVLLRHARPCTAASQLHHYAGGGAGLARRVEQGGRGVPPDRPAAQDRARGAHHRPDQANRDACTQPRPRDQESPGRHPRRGTAARTRARAPDLSEYTQVIMKEADRLQSLMDRLLTPNRALQLSMVNIHEVLERVRSVVLAEYPGRARHRARLRCQPAAAEADREQLIQAALNVVRNAAQALGARGRIVLRTRLARQVTLARKRYRQATAVQVDRQRPGRTGRDPAKRSSIRWSRLAKAAADSASPSRRAFVAAARRRDPVREQSRRHVLQHSAASARVRLNAGPTSR